MSRRKQRVLIYSHDSFGLGHLRRCRAIAHSLVDHDPDVSVLILSGSAIIGNYDFGARIDFVRLPGVIKLQDGEYSPLNLHMEIEEMVALRAAIIRQTAEAFAPDLFIVDKEPLGLRGEVGETLVMLKALGSALVLGVRDILDEPAPLAAEWARKRAMPALETLYDELWVYGLQQIYDPLRDLGAPEAVLRKVIYTGYLRRLLPPGIPQPAAFDGRPYILVTAGGGGDGSAMIDWVLRAYENDPDLPHPAFIVFGPFLDLDQRAAFAARIARLSNVDGISFNAHPEGLIANALGVVAMGGYNTFCEILSFDKRAVIVPRMEPRLEQHIRALRAMELGLAQMLSDKDDRDWRLMATALRHLPQQGLPSAVVVPGLLDGLDNVNRLADRVLSRRQPPGPHLASSNYA